MECNHYAWLTPLQALFSRWLLLGLFNLDCIQNNQACTYYFVLTYQFQNYIRAI